MTSPIEITAEQARQLDSKTIQKYHKSLTSSLKNRAIKIFNAWIRKRDEGNGCISCGSYNELQAGHFHSAGNFNHMRFLEDNAHSQCKKCNYFLSGNLIKYRANLIQKIGGERVERLDLLASQKGAHITDRFYLIEIIEKYKKI